MSSVQYSIQNYNIRYNAVTVLNAKVFVVQILTDTIQDLFNEIVSDVQRIIIVKISNTK